MFLRGIIFLRLKEEMNFIENYLHILKESGRIIRACEDGGNTNVPDYKMAKEIYLNAFHGLVTAGYPYRTEEGEMVVEICGDRYQSETAIPSISEPSAVKATYNAKPADKAVFVRNHAPVEEPEEDEDEYVTDVEDMTLSPEERKAKEAEMASPDPEEEVVEEMEEPDAELIGEPKEVPTEEPEEVEGVEDAIPEDVNKSETIDKGEESSADEIDFDSIEEPMEEPDGFEMEPNDFDPMGMEEDGFEMEPDDFDPTEMEEPDEMMVPGTEIDEPDEEPVEEESDLEEPAVKKEQVEVASEEVPVAQETEQEVAPAQEPAKGVDMPDHMHKDDFTFNFDRIRVSDADGNVREDARLLVMPMSLSVDNPEILACAIINRKSHVVASKNGVVNVEIAGYQVEIKGYMDGGVFATQYKLDQAAIDAGVIIQTKSKHHGLSGHIVLDDEGTMIHVLPAGFSNDESGHATFIYYINVNGEETMGDTSDGKPVTFMFQGKELRLQARWKDDVMYCYVSEYQE